MPVRVVSQSPDLWFPRSRARPGHSCQGPPALSGQTSAAAPVEDPRSSLPSPLDHQFELPASSHTKTPFAGRASTRARSKRETSPRGDGTGPACLSLQHVPVTRVLLLLLRPLRRLRRALLPRVSLRQLLLRPLMLLLMLARPTPRRPRHRPQQQLPSPPPPGSSQLRGQIISTIPSGPKARLSTRRRIPSRVVRCPSITRWVDKL